MKKFINVLALLALCLFPPLARAQLTTTVADGTMTNSYIPFYGLWADAYTRSQFIYPTTMLNDLTPGSEISSLTFFSSTTSQNWGAATFEVRLGEVSQTTLSSYLTYSYTTVYSGALSLVNGQLTITFTTPYVYQGGNLMVEFWQTAVGTYHGEYFYGVSATGASASGYNSNATGQATFNQCDFLAKVQIEYAEGGDITCYRPRGLNATDIDSNGLTLHWVDTMNSGATYTVAYWAAGSTDTSYEYSATDTFSIISGLNPATQYFFAVTADCGDGSIVTPVMGSWRTECGTVAIPFTEGFESIAISSTPDCWTVVGGNPNVQNGYPNTGNGYLRFSGATINAIALPPTSLPASQLQLHFWHRPESNTNASCGKFNVGYMTDLTNANSFVAVATWRYNDFASDAYVEEEVPLAGVPDGAYIVLRHDSCSTNWYWFVDDVVLEPIPACARPTMVSASNYTEDGADITVLGADGANFRIYWSQNGTVIDSADVFDTPYTITSLAPNTTYTVTAVTLCDDGSVTNSVSTSFRTLCGVITDMPYSMTFEGLSAGDIPDCWAAIQTGTYDGTAYPSVYSSSSSSHAGSKLIQFRNSNGGTEILALPQFENLTTKSLSFYAAVLNVNMVLEVGVLDGNTFDVVDTINLVAGSGSNWRNAYQLYTVYFANYSGNGTRMALRVTGTTNSGYQLRLDDFEVDSFSGCYPVSDVAISDITPDGMTLSWEDDLNSGVSYNIYYRVSGNSQDTFVVNTNDLYYVFTGLANYTRYYFAVSADCGDSESEVSATVDDRTLRACPQPTNLTVNNATTNTITISWTPGYEETQWLLGIGDTSYVINTNPYTITGLAINTAYTLTLSSLCSGGDTSQTTSVSTRTLAGDPISVFPYTCGFETGEGSDWVLENGSQTNYWMIGSATNNGGTNSMYVTNNGADNAYSNSTTYVFAYATFSLAAGEYIYSYDWKAEGQGSNDFIRAAIVPNDVVFTAGSYCGFSSGSSVPTGGIAIDGASRLNLSSNWTTQSGTFTITQGGLYNMVFLWRNNSSTDNQPPAAIDNIYLTPNTCPSPTNFAVTTAGDTANFTWTDNNGGAWEVVYGPVGFTPSSATTSEYAFTTSLEVTGLATGFYDAWLRTNCGADNSLWVGPLNFSVGITVMNMVTQGIDTLRTCAALIYDNGGPNGDYGAECNSTLVLLPNNPGSEIIISGSSYTESTWDYLTIYEGIGVGGTVLWTDNGVTQQQSFGPFSAPAITVVFVSDGSVYYSGYEITASCSAASDCPKPTQLVCTSVLADSVAVEWNENGSATSWQLAVGPAGFNPDTLQNLITTYDSFYVFTNLTAGVAYDIYVHADCGNEYSLWSSPLSVTPGQYIIGTSGSDVISLCGGVIYDNGGPNGQYSNNVDFTLTIYPSDPDSILVFNGSAYTEGSIDYLKIYEGPNANGTLLWETSSNSQQDIIHADTCYTGPITLVFHSDLSIVYSGFELFVNCIAAPACDMPTNLVVTGASDTTIDISYLGTASSYQLIISDGVTADTIANIGNSYTFFGLNPSTYYTIFVASMCEDGSVTPGISTSIRTQCAGGGCDIIIDMDDSFGDGWNDNAIRGYVNGALTFSATIDNGSSGSYTYGMCNGDTVILRWHEGSYPAEATFTVTVGGIIAASGSGSNYSNNQVVATINGCPSCPPPSMITVSNITSTSAVVTWQPSGDETMWEISTGDNSYIATTTTFNLTGLTATTGYNLRIRAICSDSDTGMYSPVVRFSTSMCDNGELYTNYDSTSTATTSSYSPIGYSLYNYSYVQTIIDSAVMAQFTGDITAFGFMPTNTNGGTQFNGMNVYMANVSESNLTSGFIHPDANHVFVQVIENGNFNYDEANAWQYHSFDTVFHWDGHSNVLFAVNRLNGTYNGTSSFAAHNVGADKMRYAYMDGNAFDINTISPNDGSSNYASSIVGDIMFVSCGEGCAAPMVNVTNITAQSATVNVTGSGLSYEMQYGTDNAELGNPMTNSTGVFNLTGLQPETQYFYAVRQECDSAMLSNWYTGSFTTDELGCLPPTNLAAISTDYTAATLGWTVGNEEAAWEVHVFNATYDTIVPANTTGITVNGLDNNRSFSAAVRALCGVDNDIEGPWSDTITFSTDSCYAVTNIQTSVTSTTAIISWTGSSASYRIAYMELPFNMNDAEQVTVNTNSYTITGLYAETQYGFVIINNCAEGVNTATGVQTFTTLESGVEPTYYHINVVSNNNDWGTVTGTGNYQEGATVTLTATANEGYHFEQWNDGNTNATRTITVTGDATYTAFFAEDGTVMTYYTVTVTSNNDAWGTVSGGGQYAEGSTATITATPASGYRFVEWNDGNTQNPRSFTVTADVAYVATFEATEGIGDVVLGTVSLYPNPASTSVTLGLDGFEGEVSVDIVDMNGRVVYTTSTTTSTIVVDVNDMPQGAYFVRVVSGTRTAVSKLIVK